MKQTALKLAVAAVAGILTLPVVGALSEVALRSILGVSAHYEMYKVARFDEEMGWRLIPGSYEFFNPLAFTTSRISINELGLRGPALSPEVQPGSRRITIVGDSFVFAAALDEDEHLVARLSDLGGPHFDVVNASAPGYGTGQQILLLERLHARGLDLGETVVLVFFTNDILDNVGRRYDVRLRDPTRPAFELRNGALHQAHRPLDPFEGQERSYYQPSLLERSLFFGFLKSRAVAAAARVPTAVSFLRNLGLAVPLPRTPGIINGWYEDDWQEMWEVSDALLARLRDTVHRIGPERLIVVYLPSPFQVEPVFREVIESHADKPEYASLLEDIDRPQRALLASCQRHGIEFVDLTETLRHEARSRTLYFLREGHLTADGSMVVAEAIRNAARLGM